MITSHSIDSFSTDTISTTEEVDTELPKLTDNPKHDDVLDYMVLVLSRNFSGNAAFKGGYMLNKIMPLSRKTKDIDFSIMYEKEYEEIKLVLGQIAEYFVRIGLISSYKIKDTVTSTSSGGIDMYDESGSKILGVDVGLHPLTYGVKRYDIGFTEIDAFKVERMLADKVCAILSRKRFRRAKDIYDLNALLLNFDVEYKEFMHCLNERGPEWDNIPFADTVLVQYEKAWNRLILINNVVKDRELEKPEFLDVIIRFYSFVIPIKDGHVYMKWNHNLKGWVYTDDGLL